MAVVIKCFHCSNILELDEGFRGGVCRCSHCGSLLQVPKTATSTSRQRPGAPPSGIVTKRPSSPLTDPGLSSGALRSSAGDSSIGSGLTSPQPNLRSGAMPRVSGHSGTKTAAPPPAAPPPLVTTHAADVKRTNIKLYVGLTSLLAVLIAVVWIFAGPTIEGMISGIISTRRPAANLPARLVNEPEVIRPSSASYLTIPLVGKQILFSIDAGSVTPENLDLLQQGFAQAIQSLAPDQLYKVIYWPGAEGQSVPPGKIGWATKNQLTKVQPALVQLLKDPNANEMEAIRNSLELECDQLIIVTGRATFSSDVPTLATEVRTINQRIDAIRLAASGNASNMALEQLVDKAGGRFVRVDQGQLAGLVNSPTR